jgi:hypothetical protein
MATPEVLPKTGFYGLLALGLTVLLPAMALFASPRSIKIPKRLL